MPPQVTQLISDQIWTATQFLTGSTTRRIPYEVVFGLRRALEGWNQKPITISTALVQGSHFYLKSVHAEFYKLVDAYFGIQFDRILVDAPCSGTGTLARHPEIRWRLKPEQLGELHRLQCQLLHSALKQLAPGGRLVYSTCSLETEENENVITEALGNLPDVERVTASEAGLSISPHLADGVEVKNLFDDLGQFHTAPGAYQTDGFFAALLQKR